MNDKDKEELVALLTILKDETNSRSVLARCNEMIKIVRDEDDRKSRVKISW